MEREPLKILVDKTKQTIGVNDAVLIDNSRSFDPNTRARTLQHEWHCQQVLSETTPCSITLLNKTIVSFKRGVKVNKAALLVQPGRLQPGR